MGNLSRFAAAAAEFKQNKVGEPLLLHTMMDDVCVLTTSASARESQNHEQEDERSISTAPF